MSASMRAANSSDSAFKSAFPPAIVSQHGTAKDCAPAWALHREQRGEPQENEEPAAVRDRRDHHARARRGIAAELLHEEWYRNTHRGGEQEVQQHGRGHHEPELPVVVDEE